MIKENLKLKLEEILGLKCAETSEYSQVSIFEACSIKSSDRKQVINYEELIKDKLKRKLEEMLGFKKPDSPSESEEQIP